MNYFKPHLPPGACAFIYLHYLATLTRNTESEYSVAYHEAPTNGGTMTIRTFTPTPSGKQGQTFPCYVFIHGGGEPPPNRRSDTYLFGQAL
jgi:acetyl esterase/lipase